ncbi:hypothetical protein GSI_02229 [Ganoderma sinense ZZ0214-1]|uniref:Uncharacterized protein n=1 Tax=Ganoderma sinense ZZ0214-1 TaxID=1077348 RepID=A0A2G8SP13_9APHY|nr:hypothetical protein GSI_02229 [Ganoderma sinense ZZ0214-1]
MSPHYYGYPPDHHPRSLGMSMANRPVFVISRPMPQQPIPPGFRPTYRPSQSRQQPSRSRTKHQQTRHADRRKRHGRVFDSNPLRGTVYDTDDVESTWSMSGFVRPSRTLLRTSGSMGARARNSSPAQEIAARYRAAHTNGSPVSDTTTFLDVPHNGGDGGWGYPAKGKRSRKESAESDLSDVSGPRLRYAVSQAHAMDRATREAYVMAVQCGGRYMNVPCQRPGCRAILPTIRDLASHLAMHDLEPRARFASQPRYHSFLNMGHSVSEGRPRRRRMPPSPYSYFRRTRSKLRRYLANLTFRCAPRRVDDDDDFFF